jgi:16S rRNA (cytosine967-C5)-methyltransferase
MSPAICAVVERVIGRASCDRPADGLLREELKAQRGFSREQGALASKVVFAWFRWRGWLDENEAIRDQAERALRLTKRFARDPKVFSDAELMERAVPEWVGTEIEVTPAWARTIQGEPRLWLRTKRAQGEVLAGRLGDCRVFEAAPMPDTLEYMGSEDLFRTPAFQEGEFELQDLSSQAVGVICGAQPGQTWWDACVGEGGKMLHLSELMENKGMIWASDRAAWRLQKLKRRAARARVFNYRAALWDGGPRLPSKTKFDGVLVDAPCSGIGTWQRNPHARWTTTIEDVRELAEIQKQLLAHAAPAVKAGGKLIYAVCTLARSETVDVAEEFGRRFTEFAPLPVSDPLNPAALTSSQIWCRPEQFGGSGMFVAAWIRRAA